MQSGPEEIAEGVRRLHAGRLVAFPTETVYGLGADARSESAVAGVFRAKGRPAGNPLIVHVSDAAMAGTVVAGWTPEADALARAFWPGPLTIVLPRAPWVPNNVTARGDTVGVRCPDHSLTLALISAFGAPLVGPSANRSGRVSPTTAEHVRESFDPDLVLVLDGGPCTGGIESTVVDLSEGQARILRPGLITGEQIGHILGLEVGREVGRAGAPQERGAKGVLRSPGLLEQHYAPVAKAVLVSREELDDIRAKSARLVVITQAMQGALASEGEIVLPGDVHGYAAGLYAALREADAKAGGQGLIAIVRPTFAGADSNNRGIAEAIMDRLGRATAS
jgi:L-threonylcarbamoyladenylate synthase